MQIQSYYRRAVLRSFSMKVEKFLDLTRITVKGGTGGIGSYFHERSRKVVRGGKKGGNGGKGGDIYLKGVDSISPNLYHYGKKVYEGNVGSGGKNHNVNGGPGADIHISIPINTKIYTVKATEMKEHLNFIGELDKPGKTILVAKGGEGGLGNMSRQYEPNKQKGKEGQEKLLEISLSIPNDVALIGFTCTGKSSLLERITGVKGVISEIDINTLNPLLGMVKYIDEKRLKILDMPPFQLSADGKGIAEYLGFKHLSSSKLIVIVINGSTDSYKHEVGEILKKLKELDMKAKKLCFVINKCDLISEQQRTTLETYFKALGAPYFFTSAVTGENKETLIKYFKSAVFS